MEEYVVRGSKDEYTVNVSEATCTCPQWKFRCRHFPIEDSRRLCKHLKEHFDAHPQDRPGVVTSKVQMTRLAQSDVDGEKGYPRAFLTPYISTIRSILRNSLPDGVETYIGGGYEEGKSHIFDTVVLVCTTHEKGLKNLMKIAIHFISGIEILREDDDSLITEEDGLIEVKYKFLPPEKFIIERIFLRESKESLVSLIRKFFDAGYQLSIEGVKKIGSGEWLKFTTEEELIQHRFNH